MSDRVSRIVRIYQNDDSTSDVWVDIERPDSYTVTNPDPSNAGLQSSDYTYDWDNAFDPKNTKLNHYKFISDPSDPDSVDQNAPKPGDFGDPNNNLDGNDTGPDTLTGSTIKIPLRYKIDVQDAEYLYHFSFDNSK